MTNPFTETAASRAAPALPLPLARLVALHDGVFSALGAQAAWLVPTLARLVFAGVLLSYYWGSAATKLGSAPFTFSAGAYAQIFPGAAAAVSYDISQLSVFHWLVVLAGTAAEFVLPLLIVAGLFTRLAALGMIGFVAVQSWVDIHGHGLGAADIGAWFDRDASALILDQRAFWVFLLTVLVLVGAGPLSADRAARSLRR